MSAAKRWASRSDRPMAIASRYMPGTVVAAFRLAAPDCVASAGPAVHDYRSPMTRTRSFVPVTVFVALALLVAACSDDSSGSRRPTGSGGLTMGQMQVLGSHN